MKNGKIKAFFLLHMLLLFYSLSALCSKYASEQDFLSTKFFLLYGIVLGILFIYAILWQQILKLLPLVTAYANKAITVIWGIIWGKICFEEEISFKQILASVIIMLGVYFVASADGEAENV